MEIRITESKRQSKTAYGKQLSGILLETALIWLSAGGGLLLFMSVLTEQERMAPIFGKRASYGSVLYCNRKNGKIWALWTAGTGNGFHRRDLPVPWTALRRHGIILE